MYGYTLYQHIWLQRWPRDALGPIIEPAPAPLAGPIRISRHTWETRGPQPYKRWSDDHDTYEGPMDNELVPFCSHKGALLTDPTLASISLDIGRSLDKYLAANIQCDFVSLCADCKDNSKEVFIVPHIFLRILAQSQDWVLADVPANFLSPEDCQTGPVQGLIYMRWVTWQINMCLDISCDMIHPCAHVCLSYVTHHISLFNHHHHHRSPPPPHNDSHHCWQQQHWQWRQCQQCQQRQPTSTMETATTMVPNKQCHHQTADVACPQYFSLLHWFWPESAGIQEFRRNGQDSGWNPIHSLFTQKKNYTTQNRSIIYKRNYHKRNK